MFRGERVSKGPRMGNASISGTEEAAAMQETKNIKAEGKPKCLSFALHGKKALRHTLLERGQRG